MTSIRPCAVGFGELVWDILPHARIPGGAPSNFAWHAQQLGAHSAIVSAVGNDKPGRDLLQWLETKGLATDHVQTTQRPTGRVEVSVNEHGEPRYVIDSSSAWDEIAWTDSLEALARRADCVCFGSLSQRSNLTRETLYRFLRSTRPECLRVFDVNLRHPLPSADVIENSLQFTNVLKLNEAEWPFIATALGLPTDWMSGSTELLRKTRLQIIAITRGAIGSVLLTPNQTIALPAEPVQIDDTIGAGDAFAAALTAGLVFGMPLRHVQLAATKVSAFVCTQPGATPELPLELKELTAAPSANVHLPKTNHRFRTNVHLPRTASNEAVDSL